MEKIAYHTPTKQSVIDRAKKWKEEGTEVYDGFLSGEYWENYKEKTCVDIEDNRMSCQNKNFYKEKGYKIIPYKQEKKLEYGYCEAGDVVVVTNGVERTIIAVNEDKAWLTGCNRHTIAYLYTWEEIKSYASRDGWHIKTTKRTVEDVLSDLSEEDKKIVRDSMR